MEVGFNEPGIIIMKVSDVYQYSGYFNNEKKTSEKIIKNAFGDGEVWDRYQLEFISFDVPRKPYDVMRDTFHNLGGLSEQAAELSEAEAETCAFLESLKQEATQP